MGINNQPYLAPLFNKIRAEMIAQGQKVQPITPSYKTKPLERKYVPDVVLTISGIDKP